MYEMLSEDENACNRLSEKFSAYLGESQSLTAGDEKWWGIIDWRDVYVQYEAMSALKVTGDDEPRSGREL